MMSKDGYSTDDEEWFELEKKDMRTLAREDVRKLCNRMLAGKDKNRISRYLGISTETLRKKIYRGTIKGDELLMLSYLCGYQLEAKDVCQLVMEEVLCD